MLLKKSDSEFGAPAGRGVRLRLLLITELG
jgi:hypothetical protein